MIIFCFSILVAGMAVGASKGWELALCLVAICPILGVGFMVAGI